MKECEKYLTAYFSDRQRRKYNFCGKLVIIFKRVQGQNTQTESHVLNLQISRHQEESYISELYIFLKKAAVICELPLQDKLWFSHHTRGLMM